MVWGREQVTATPMENLQHQSSKGGDSAAGSAAPSASVASSMREMPFQSWLGMTNLSKEQAAGMLQLGLQVHD